MSFISDRKKPIVIGMVHFSALEGSDGFEGDKQLVLDRAMEDLRTLQEGGVDAVLFENNFDTPKFAALPKQVALHFEVLLEALTPKTRVPWGISALWNDYAFGFRMCKKFGGVMVRVPVFVDSVLTTYGRFMAEPKKVLEARRELDATEILLLADVHVKHAELIQPRPFEESTRAAVEAGADAIIITGQWTGDPPSPEQCKLARKTVGAHMPILTGSGMTAENVESFLPFIDGCIVGTAFKERDIDFSTRQGPNIVEAERRLDLEKIKKFMRAIY
ncbi:MAG: BtpA/SgcQ family protein [Candidatus Uhrbacteria bacterium]|nr:BtpA/SgcQ family protein [Candidatus Uhrbacteria bacterium]